MLVCLPCLAFAGEGFVPPRSATPVFYVIRSIHKDKGTIDLVAMGLVPAEPVDLKALKALKPLKTKLIPLEMTWVVEVSKAHTAAGKRIESSKVWDMVKVGQVVVLSAGEQDMDPRFRALFKADTIIVSWLKVGKE
jgi:hypothetical protein